MWAIILLFCLPVFSQNLKLVVDSRENGQKLGLKLIKNDGSASSYLLDSLTNDVAVKVNEFHFSTVSEFYLNDSFFLTGKDDSLHLSFNPTIGKYIIDGGKYNDNYDVIKNIGINYIDRANFSPPKNGYEHYIDSIDIVYRNRSFRLDSIMSLNKMSKDVYAYVKEIIKYKRISNLLSFATTEAKKYWPGLGETRLREINLDITNPQFYTTRYYYYAGFSYFLLKTANEFESKIGFNFFDQMLKAELPLQAKIILLTTSFTNSSLAKQMDKNDLTYIYREIGKFDLSEKVRESLKDAFNRYIVDLDPIPGLVKEQTRLVTTEGKTMSLAELLLRYKGGKLIIDFWASWCGPCLAGIPDTKKLAITRPDIKIIYISLDDNKVQWRKKYEQHEIKSNQYLLIGNFESPLAKYLVINGIPLYVYLDTEGRLQFLNGLYNIPSI